MSASRTQFYLDKQNAKFKGVCAGIADYTGIDALWVRVAAVLLTVSGVGIPWVPLAYVLVAWMATAKPIGLYQTDDDAKFWQGVRSNPKRSTAEVRSKFRDIDRRLADIELHYTSRNSRLADEIDSLR
ncbi:envelope stress response membrane protein PspC [Sphingomonas carotinifaciens]|uniref:Envelope stress response membrane protein PspC n=1 Tax=Sphingomonas carotinifaciens TaxID=1166323 RepID=A0A1G7ILJ0_9SPHN|nr:envelope stress response membrane protein PspC [Sphingomonas carotinifaciens]MBB4084821.1 phage shock protein C [Sphingomonas carotinifaciens]MWC44208.1 envelope stress response membrane protein PspC [Sphingomonas carotinifaciens]SDF13571.1 phage shock protein C (PspC) family protein [Sphingomonas carotinifaciens]